ncbi:MAG: helix-turn-helix transcriptional regulator [Actinomycetes bacterium]
MSRRSHELELAVLGLLHETPLHGYELRKRLNVLLGSFRAALSYGTLYPCLKDLDGRGLIATEGVAAAEAARRSGRRSKIVYRLTPEGKEHFQEMLEHAGPSTWEDEGFGVRFAFFSRTDREVRMRILEGRRSRLEERLERVRAAMTRTRERLDRYTLELQNHGLESVEREVRWLNELIQHERDQADTPEGTDGPGTRPAPTPTTSEDER